MRKGRATGGAGGAMDPPLSKTLGPRGAISVKVAPGAKCSLAPLAPPKAEIA